MRLRFDKLGRIARIDDDRGFVVAVLLALIVTSAVVASYFAYAAYGLTPEKYNTIYLLDANREAINYPTVLVANQNSTFNVVVGVVNHSGGTAKYEVRVKITQNLATLPLAIEPTQTLSANLKNGETWENQATITQNTPGTYVVVFELWRQTDGTYVFQGNNYCVLNILVTS